MRVILLQDVANLGRKNEIKEVSDGYARNFLFAKNLAKPVTLEALKSMEAQKEREEKEKSEEYQKQKAIVEKLKSLELKFKVKIGEKEKAFGSVTSTKLKAALAKQGILVEKESILLEDSIKTTGERKVKIKLPHDLVGEVKVIVEAEPKSLKPKAIS